MPQGMSLLLLYILVTLPALAGRAFAVRLLGFDDDEGWALGRTLGLVLVAFPAWWVGVAGLAHWHRLGGAVLVVGAVFGCIDLVRHRPDWRALARAEIVFLVAVVAVIWLRLPRPEILQQEKLMDLGIFASLLRADGFPPPDMWLAGETLPYYYWGAVLWTVPLNLSRVPLDIAYNLVVAAVAGLSACLLWALGRRAGGTGLAGWAAVGVGLFAGTVNGVRQLIGGVPLAGLDVWQASRQVPDTITEWPLFTVWLGDLHPHYLSIPLALATILVAWQSGARGPRPGSVTVIAVLFGVTWAANPWAMPPTLVASALMLLCGDGEWHWPGRSGWPRWAAIVVVAVGGWLAAVAFHLSFHPPFQGIRPVFAWTEPATLLLWGGALLLPVAAACWGLLTELLGPGQPSRAVALALVALTLVAASVSGRPTLILLAGLLVVLVLAGVSGPSRRDRPAVALAALGVFLLAVPEVVYVVDSYGDQLHRMNTVFKCYIQAWVLLAVALPALMRIGFERRSVRSAAIVVVVALMLPHPLGLAIQPITDGIDGLDGLAWLEPGDRAIVSYLRRQPHGVTIVEAVGGAYTEYARISSASGVPAVLGWANHELVWRGHGSATEIERRRQLIETIYSSGDPERVAAAVARTGAELVVIGALETRDFDPVQLDAVRAAGEVVLDEAGGQLVHFPSAGAGEDVLWTEEAS
jgi:YYY domain-containing protein